MKKLLFPLLVLGLVFSSCKKDEPVNQGTVTINQTEKSVYVPETFTITPTISSTGEAKNKEYKWKSSADSIASVENTGSGGLVTANRTGDAIITFYSTDGVFSKTCTVSVGKKSSLLNGLYFVKGAKSSDINVPSGYTSSSATGANFLDYSAPNGLQILRLIYEFDGSASVSTSTIKALYVILYKSDVNKADAEQYLKERFYNTKASSSDNFLVYLNTESKTRFNFETGTKFGVFTNVKIGSTINDLGVKIY